MSRSTLEPLSFLEQKAVFFDEHDRERERKHWYFVHYIYFKYFIKQHRRVRRLKSIKRLPKYLDFLRWVLIDLLSHKQHKFWGIYQFVALPGEGKTLSMVAHMERALETNPNLIIGTNFHYERQSFAIDHWTDIIKIAKFAKTHSQSCIIAMDEIHVTFDATDWQKFPAELLALLSFNRKFSLQFLCSAQIYERIPKKIRDIANYTVICKNVWKLDRMFVNYYFDKNNYEASFTGKRDKADFIRDYIATDDLYNLYDTLEQVDNMTAKAKDEADRKKAAFDLLFGKPDDESEIETVPEQPGD